MNTLLSETETRIIGCLIEKEKTTPDQYPLSINALTSACNQKTNREPVMNLSEIAVQETVDTLMKKHLISRSGSASARVDKYQHRFANTEFSEFKFNNRELAVVCVLFLRGPQTPGELRTRSNRLCDFNDIQEVEDTLEQLRLRDDGPFVVKLPREAGRRESRYAHLFSGEVDISQFVSSSPATSAAQDFSKMQELEHRLSLLEEEVARLKEMLS